MDKEDNTPQEGIECTIDEVIEYCHILPIKWWPTKKNKDFRRQAGLLIDDIYEYVKTLREEYYLKELEDLTEGHSGKMYVFKRLVEEKYFCYIKVKINKTNEGKMVLVVSFHDDESLIY